VGTGSVPSLDAWCDISGQAAPLIRCVAPADQIGPCGVLGVEQIAAAAEAGLCCRQWLSRNAPGGAL
jgi:hypothetical protein